MAPRPTPKLEDQPSSAVRNCLFNLFAGTLLIGGRSSIRNLRTHLAVVTGTHYVALYRLRAKYYDDDKIKEYGLGRACCKVGQIIKLTENFKLQNQVLLNENG